MMPVRSGSTPARTINWLFFDLANDRSDVIPTIIFADSFDNPVLLLNDWADVLWTQFKFRLDESTLQFFRVSYWPALFFPSASDTFLLSRLLP